jgi:Rrf2 family protein
VPAGYLSKVLQSLGRAQLVNSQRGLHGGFTLARAPSELTVWEVIQAVDPLQRIRSCPLGL